MELIQKHQSQTHFHAGCCGRVAKGGGQTRDDLSNQPVQIGVGWAFNVQVPSANIIESFVVIHDRHIRVLKQGVHAQHLYLQFGEPTTAHKLFLA